MVDGWTCGRCSTPNVEASLICSVCGLTRPDDPIIAKPAGAPATPPGETVPASPAPSVPPPDEGVGFAAVTRTAATPDGIVGWAAPDSDAGATSTTPGPIWRRIPIGWLVVGVLVLGGAVVGWYFNAGRSSSGEIDRRGDLTASELRVGDCFDLKDPTADEVEDVTASPCTVEHEYEVIFVGSLPEGDYPAEAAFDDYVKTNCQPAFGSYVGTAYADSELDIFWFYPTDDAWRSGDRSVQCAAFHPQVHRLTESLKGTSQ